MEKAKEIIKCVHNHTPKEIEFYGCETNVMNPKYTKLLDHLHDLFPVPEHFNFELLPSDQQQRIIGQGEVMTELTTYINEKLKV